MPFATKFRAMMDLPFPGDDLGDYTVESVDVSHRSGDLGLYAYSVRMVLSGPGGQAGVRRALKPLLSARRTTFSGYGNPYQLWFGKPEIESLGDRRYAVNVEGAGARVSLTRELDRFLATLDEGGQLAVRPDHTTRKLLIETYLQQYRAEIKRKVDRYRRRLHKAGPTDT
jgi:hypothetical protein